MPAARRCLGCVLLCCLAAWLLPPAAAASPALPPLPVPDPHYINLFYGAVPPASGHASVMVFVPGFLENAFMWWGPVVPQSLVNDMYAYAYGAGYRTAFISPDPLNLPSTGSIQTNAQMLETLMPVILARYQVSRVYFIGHSKGGLDISSMLADPRFTGMAKAVFTLSSPNQGDALADWCYGDGVIPCTLLGLEIPAIYDMQTFVVSALRVQWDPVFQAAGIPFYTLSGNTWSNNPLTLITGPILKSLTGGSNAPPNDGIVDHPESLLPASYALELGVINGNHFQVPLGHNAFPFIAQHTHR
jgi:hypothetical protein